MACRNVEAANKAALESLGIDYESFGQKPWNEGDLDYEAPNGDYIKKGADLSQAYFVHANFVIGSKEKKQLFQAAGLWNYNT